MPGARDYEEYWQNLIQGRDSKSMAGFDQMGVDPHKYFDSAKGVADKFYCMQGGYIRDFEFDPSRYDLPEAHLEKLDDMFKWSLYTAREALEDSGYLDNEDNREHCGVILGNLSFPTKYSNHLFIPIYHRAVEASLQKLTGENSPGNEKFRLPHFTTPEDVSDENAMISGYPSALIARAFNLSGTSFSIDAACSSSIYSVKLACDYLMSGRADMMLAGAVSAADPFFVNMGFSIFQAYPNIPGSSPLDKDSRGLVAGEGAGMFVLKRHEDALKDGDKIYANILGAGLSNDGRGQSVLSPSADGQNLAFERAYKKAGINPRETEYVECHATGTPLGDKVELDSMDTFFGKYGASPLAGSSKSNLGHLLTAAGMSGMIKTILSMSRNRIPPTINLKNALSSKNNVISAGQIPAVVRTWPGNGDIRHAAVSGFGFGGTNGHIVLESDKRQGTGNNKTPEVLKSPGLRRYKPRRSSSGEAASPFSMAIIGMDALFGNSRGLAEFHRTAYDGLQHFIPLPEKRWKGIEKYDDILKSYGFEDGMPPKGAYVDKFDLDFLRFRIPPNKDDRLIPQQLITLKVADNAIREARLKEGSNVAVLVAMGTELALHQFRGRVNLTTQLKESFSDSDTTKSEALEACIKESIHGVAKANQYTSFIGNIMASRIASVWDFSGPAFSISSEENSVYKSLEAAQLLLENSEADAVVVAAVDLSGGFENVLLKNRRTRINKGQASLSFDRNSDGWMVGEGAGAVVLKSIDAARKQGNLIYAAINAVEFAKGKDDTTVAAACKKAFDSAGVSPADIDYLEVHASGISEEDQAEISGLVDAYKGSGQQLKCAIGSVKANIGHTFAASGMASLIRTALCLYNRFIPRSPGWSGPKYPDEWKKSPFFVPTESRTWFADSKQKSRIAAISGMGADETCAHLILSDEPGQTHRESDYFTRVSPSLIIITGDNPRDMEAGLDSVLSLSALDSDKDMSAIAEDFYKSFSENTSARYRLSLLGQSKKEIHDEAEAAKIGIQQAFKDNEDWSSEGGSYFTPEPLGCDGKIAFVYPGGFNSYIGLGRNLFQLFPEVYEKAGDYTSQLGDLLGSEFLYPKSMTNLSEEEIKSLSSQLFNTPAVMFESGIMSAILYTDIIRESFGISPDQALGYSMGEVSMLFALGVWDRTDKISKSLRESPVFQSRITGSMDNVREAWNLSDSDKKKIWYSYKLEASPDAVRKALEKDLHPSMGRSAYLIFVNTPNEVVIAGDDQACKRIIRDLGCNYFEVPVTDAIHSELVRPDYKELINMHRLPVNEVSNIDFYSAFDFAPIVVDSDIIAKNVANIYANEIDFQKLIEKAYDDGGRVFIELGPRDNCSKWIDEILRHKKHLSAGIDKRGDDENVTIIQILAKLFCHKVSLDLSPLFVRSKMESVSKRLLVKSITLGGDSIESGILTPENREIAKEITKDTDSQVYGAAQEQTSARIVCKKELQVLVVSDSAEAEESRKMNETISENRQIPAPVPSFLCAGEQELSRNISLLNASHEAFLNTRKLASRQIRELIALQIALVKKGDRAEDTPARASEPEPVEPESVEPESVEPEPVKLEPKPEPEKPEKKKNIIWDQDDLLEFAGGSIAKVFGDEYAIIDTYHRKVRLPLMPYLLVTRVTELNAKRGEFKPSTMTTEYDIPFNAWYCIDGQIPWAVSVESGQCDLLLISYLGIDFSCKGERVYRLLDCTLTFLEDMAMEGETLRYEISINSFAKSGKSLLFFFSYECFVKERMVLKMDGGCAGFFTDEELAAGKGIIYSEEEIQERNQTEKKSFTPFLVCDKKAFERNDLIEIIKGNQEACFGRHYSQNGLNQSLRFSSEEMLMIDRVTSIDIDGGPWGLGRIMAEKILDPDHWYFPCHFKDDEVMAGSLMAEGCGQLLQFFLLYVGMHTRTKDARFQPIKNLPQKVRCRGQVIPKDRLLTYRMEIMEIGLAPHPYAIANIDILLEDKIVVDFKNLGVQLVEKHEDDPYKICLPEISEHQLAKQVPRTEEKEALFTQYHLQNFATGSISECFGPEFEIYENRQPPRTPNGDLQLTTRVLEVVGERHDFSKPAYAIAEYDVPHDAWYYEQNSHPGVMPYSIIMEIALQPCGFISACMGTTLIYPETDFYFRNLDGAGKLHQDIDLRGKTVRNKSTLLSTAAMGNTILQSFEFEMEVDGKPYYTGTAAFGYFVEAALRDQVGLDSGIDNHPLTEKKYLSDGEIEFLDLKSEDARKRYYEPGTKKPYYRLTGPQLDFLNMVQIVKQGGKKGLGYIYSERKLRPADWFFKCHFYQDPVMPGSLGVESVMQALQVFALNQDLGAQFISPRFTQIEDIIVWKYRGQMNPDIDLMAIEVHITKIEKKTDKVTLVGDASLWKDKIRIYEIKDIALCIEEA